MANPWDDEEIEDVEVPDADSEPEGSSRDTDDDEDELRTRRERRNARIEQREREREQALERAARAEERALAMEARLAELQRPTVADEDVVEKELKAIYKEREMAGEALLSIMQKGGNPEAVESQKEVLRRLEIKQQMLAAKAALREDRANAPRQDPNLERNLRWSILYEDIIASEAAKADMRAEIARLGRNPSDQEMNKFAERIRQTHKLGRYKSMDATEQMRAATSGYDSGSSSGGSGRGGGGGLPREEPHISLANALYSEEPDPGKRWKMYVKMHRH